MEGATVSNLLHQHLWVPGFAATPSSAAKAANRMQASVCNVLLSTDRMNRFSHLGGGGGVPLYCQLVAVKCYGAVCLLPLCLSFHMCILSCIPLPMCFAHVDHRPGGAKLVICVSSFSEDQFRVGKALLYFCIGPECVTVILME